MVPVLNPWSWAPTAIRPAADASDPERPSKARPHLSTRKLYPMSPQPMVTAW